MDSIKSILENRVIKKNNFNKPKQLKLFYKKNLYYQAKKFADDLNLNVYFVLKCIKKFGGKRVFSTYSFLKDYPTKKQLSGLLLWKLENSINI